MRAVSGARVYNGACPPPAGAGDLPIRHGRQQRRWDAWPRADHPVLVRSACPSV